MANEIVKYQPQNALLKKADNYFAHLNALMPKKYAPDLPDLIPYRKGDLWGFCDNDKNIVIDCKYDDVHRFYDGLAYVMINGESRGFIDKNGVEVIPLTFLIYSWQPSDFSEGFSVISSDGMYGYMNRKGEKVIPFKYEHAYNFKDGLALVGKERDNWNGKWGFINKDGTEVIACKYQNAWHFSEGLASVLINNKYGFIDKYGNEIIKTKYDEAGNFNNGIARVSLNGKSWFIDKNDVEIEESLLNLKMQWKITDEKGVELQFPAYEKVGLFYDELAMVNKPMESWFRRYGYINKTGAEVISCIYHNADNFNNGLAKVMKYSVWGFINKLGIEVIPLKYTSVLRDFMEGLAYVREYKGTDNNAKENRYAYIDILGNEYWEEVEHEDNISKKKELFNNTTDNLLL